MNVLCRRLGLLVAATGAALSLLAVPAPAASAATPPGPAPVTAPAAARPVPAVAFGRWTCRPVHTGPNWRWDEMRRGSHWDQRVWNPRTRRLAWQHDWRDDHYCVWVRVDGPPPGRSTGPVGNGPVRNGPGTGPAGNPPGAGPVVNGPVVHGPVVNGPVVNAPVGNQPPPRRP